MSRTATYGNGRIFKRGRTWWLDYGVGGERVRRSARTTDRAAALRQLREAIGAKAAGAPAPGRATFEGLKLRLLRAYQLEGRRSVGRATAALAHLGTVFGSDKASAITTDRLEEYAAMRLAAGAKPATVKYELAILRRAFRLAAKAKAIGQLPAFPTIGLDNARKVFFTPAEFRALCAHLPGDLVDVVTFAYCTGWRVDSEILTLRWDAVDLAAGVVTLRTSKNREGRTFPLATLPQLRQVLERRRAWTATLEGMDGGRIAHVFHRRGEPIRDFRTAWRAACAAAGIGAKIPHDFRRTAVRNLVRAGVPRSIAMQLTGHKTDAVFRRYDIVDERDLRTATAQLAEYLAEHAAH